MYDPLYQSLLAFRFNAEQLASIQPAGLPGILKGQPPPTVLDVGHLVAWALCPAPTDSLACTQQHEGDSKIMYAGVLSEDFLWHQCGRNIIHNLQYHQRF